MGICKAFFLPALLFLSPIFVFAQIPRLSKVAIQECSCSVYMPQGNTPFEKSYSEDSSMVFTSEYISTDNFNFVAIVVRFKESIGPDREVNEKLLMTYMDYLKSSFEIEQSAGYGTGHTMEGFPNAVGVIDYWQDKAGKSFAVKGWNDGDKLGVLFISGEGDYPHFNLQNLFLNGFRFD